MKVRSTLLGASALAAVSVLVLTGCSTASTGGDTKPSESAGGDSSLTLVTPGSLTVCSDIPYEPFEFLDGDKAVGFDMDIVQAVADDLKLELVVLDTGFDAITSGAFKATCDIAASSISITDERKKNVDFSDPYYNDDLVLVAKKGSGIASIDDAKGKKVGVQTGTTGESYGADQGLETIGYEDSGLQIQSLVSGITDASLGNQSVLRFAIKDKSDFEVVQEITTGEKLGIAAGKGNTAMIDAVNTTLARLTSSGELEKLEAKWFDGK